MPGIGYYCVYYYWPMSHLLGCFLVLLLTELGHSYAEIIGTSVQVGVYFLYSVQVFLSLSLSLSLHKLLRFDFQLGIFVMNVFVIIILNGVLRSLEI